MKKIIRNSSCRFYLLTFMILFLGFGSLKAQWAKRFGGTGHDEGYSVGVDNSGNVFQAGCFVGTVDFDPGPGVSNMTAVGDADAYLIKLNSSGELVWKIGLGSAGREVIGAFYVDGAGDIYVTGGFSNSVDFDPGPGTAYLTSVSGSGSFIAKYSSDGSYVWARNVGGGINSISPMGSNNILIAGYFGGTAEYNLGGTSYTLTSAGSNDGFFVKYDLSGNLVWAKKIGGIDYDAVGGIVSDASSNIYITGQFRETADFDPGAGTVSLTSNGDADIFYAKYDASGSLTWVKQIGGVCGDVGSNISIDGAGNLLLTGLFGYSGVYTVDFDAGPSTFNLVSSGIRDAFFTKYDQAGNFIWAFKLGSTGDEEGIYILADASNNVYVTGWFSGTVDFDPGTGTYELSTNGNNDIYVAKYTSAGAFVWVRGFGGSGIDRGFGLALGSSSYLYISGWFSNTVNFDPGPGTNTLVSLGGLDIFVGKYNTSDGTLPVELISFDCKNKPNETVELTWETSTEVNNYGFNIERKTMGSSASDWKTLSFVAGAGTSNIHHYYIYCDPVTTFGSYAYRLKQLDRDGKYEYSQVVEVEISDVNNFSLEQNYPNPFNPSTLINYSIAAPANVLLKVYDILGTEVSTLTNEYKTAGKYSVTFDASALANGVYIYKLLAGRYSEVKRLIVMK